MANVFTLGLSKIEIGAIAADGGMGSSLATLGLTYQDTCNLTTEDPQDTEHYSEENEDPEVVVSRGGKTVLSFSIMGPDFSALGTLTGGTISGSGASEVLNFPNKLPNIEKSIKITPEQGHIINIPRAKISAKLDGALSKTGILLLKVTATVLTPTKAGVPRIFVSKPSS
ncbi:hypothetical protein [Leadbetterella byssophila]|uniref:hypothetical protein n=1 Tax=Leadbetterella byssophila TaxID=316068 RepID=UPI0039A38D23